MILAHLFQWRLIQDELRLELWLMQWRQVIGERCKKQGLLGSNITIARLFQRRFVDHEMRLKQLHYPQACVQLLLAWLMPPLTHLYQQ